MLCSVSTFGLVLLFLIIGAFFALLALSVGKFFRPTNPTKDKLATYECGEETVIGSWGKFNIRFYLIALVFVLFEVEIIFLFPWAKILTDTKLQTLQTNWQIYAFVEGILFILLLALGLVYLWKNNFLDWKFNLSEKETKKISLSQNGIASQQRITKEEIEKEEIENETKKERKNTTKKENTQAIPDALYKKINIRYN